MPGPNGSTEIPKSELPYGGIDLNEGEGPKNVKSREELAAIFDANHVPKKGKLPVVSSTPTDGFAFPGGTFNTDSTGVTSIKELFNEGKAKDLDHYND